MWFYINQFSVSVTKYARWISLKDESFIQPTVSETSGLGLFYFSASTETKHHIGEIRVRQIYSIHRIQEAKRIQFYNEAFLLELVNTGCHKLYNSFMKTEILWAKKIPKKPSLNTSAFNAWDIHDPKHNELHRNMQYVQVP